MPQNSKVVPVQKARIHLVVEDAVSRVAPNKLVVHCIMGDDARIRQGFAEMLETTGTLRAKPIVLVMDKRGFDFCMNVTEGFKSSAVKLLVLLGSWNDFLNRACLVRSGGGTCYVYGATITLDELGILEQRVREASRMDAF